MGNPDGIFDPAGDEDRPADLDPPAQKPLALHPSDYVETGFVPVGRGPDGGPMIGGGEPPGPAPGLSRQTLVCMEADGREACDHYVALLTEADGVVKGFEQPLQIRRFCRKLSTASELMELGEMPIYGCTARSPSDAESTRLIRDFELRQRRAASEMARKSGDIEM